MPKCRFATEKYATLKNIHFCVALFTVHQRRHRELFIHAASRWVPSIDLLTFPLPFLFSLEPSNGISRTECIIWVIWYACLTHVLICVYHACSYMRISCALWYARFMRIPMRLFLRALTSNKMKHFLRKFTRVYFKFQKYAFLAFEMCINNTH